MKQNRHFAHLSRKTISIAIVSLCVLALTLAHSICKATDKLGSPQLEYFSQIDLTSTNVADFYSAICSNRVLEAAFIEALACVHYARRSARSRLERLERDNPALFAGMSESNRLAAVDELTFKIVASDQDSVRESYARGGEVVGSHRVGLRRLLELKRQGHPFMTAEDFDNYMKEQREQNNYKEEDIWATNNALAINIELEIRLLGMYQSLLPTCEFPKFIDRPYSCGERYVMCKDYCKILDQDFGKLVIWLFFKILDDADTSCAISREAWQEFRGVMARKGKDNG